MDYKKRKRTYEIFENEERDHEEKNKQDFKLGEFDEPKDRLNPPSQCGLVRIPAPDSLPHLSCSSSVSSAFVYLGSW